MVAQPFGCFLHPEAELVADAAGLVSSLKQDRNKGVERQADVCGMASRLNDVRGLVEPDRVRGHRPIGISHEQAPKGPGRAKTPVGSAGTQVWFAKRQKQTTMIRVSRLLDSNIAAPVGLGEFSHSLGHGQAVLY
jgi:hypothetical protein